MGDEEVGLVDGEKIRRSVPSRFSTTGVDPELEDMVKSD